MDEDDLIDPETEDDPGAQLLRTIEVNIAAGHLDNRLVDIMEVVSHRLNSGPTQALWTITYDGETYREDTMTLDEVCRAEDLAGTSWAALKPIWKGGYIRALLRSFLEHRQGMTGSQSKRIVGALTRDAALDMIGQVEVEAPKAGSEYDEAET